MICPSSTIRHARSNTRMGRPWRVFMGYSPGTFASPESKQGAQGEQLRFTGAPSRDSRTRMKNEAGFVVLVVVGREDRRRRPKHRRFWAAVTSEIKPGSRAQARPEVIARGGLARRELFGKSEPLRSWSPHRRHACPAPRK